MSKKPSNNQPASLCFTACGASSPEQREDEEMLKTAGKTIINGHLYKGVSHDLFIVDEESPQIVPAKSMFVVKSGFFKGLNSDKACSGHKKVGHCDLEQNYHSVSTNGTDERLRQVIDCNTNLRNFIRSDMKEFSELTRYVNAIVREKKEERADDMDLNDGVIGQKMQPTRGINPDQGPSDQ